MGRKKITICLNCVFVGLLQRVGISGLIGAGIGLLYTPLSMYAIGMAYDFEGNTLVEIITIPAVPFFFFAGWMGLPAAPFFTISVVLFTAVGTGIGAGIHWTKNLIRRTKASRGRP